ncbi:hypothetical protein ACFX2G_020295 [Malus domestica]
MQGLHHQQQQLAAFLSVAIPKDDSASASVPSSNSDDDDSVRLTAINSLHRAVTKLALKCDRRSVSVGDEALVLISAMPYPHAPEDPRIPPVSVLDPPFQDDDEGRDSDVYTQRDKPGHHNFDLLRKLVLSDGSVLRAKLPGKPTRDCLFADPARDRTSWLKIWNVNNLSDVVGVFNCQGAGWCKIEKKTRIHDYSPGTLSGSVRAADVDAIAQVAGADWNGETVVYAHKSGLLDMFNSSAAVEEVEIHLASDKKPELSNGEVSENRSPTATIGLKTRGYGRFGAYCSRRPLKCTVDNAETNFPNSTVSRVAAGGARETPTARISTSRETALVASATKRMARRAGRSSGSPMINLRYLCDIQPNPSSPLELHIRDAGRWCQLCRRVV